MNNAFMSKHYKVASDRFLDRRLTITMTPPQAVFHALLRPVILQILRATGFHSARPVVIDSVTDMAARYLELLCEETARHATLNNSTTLLGDLDPTVLDIRMAMEDIGALLPERNYEEQKFMDKEDIRGVRQFTEWASGPKCKEIKRIALEGNDTVEEEVQATDYLTGEAQYWSDCCAD